MASYFPSEHKSLLGIDLNLIDAKDARTRIVKACVKCWFQKNPSGRLNMGDCSGFVKAVQTELRLRPFSGDANGIFEEVESRQDWIILGTGSDAVHLAGAAANQGFLTIGVWKNLERDPERLKAITLPSGTTRDWSFAYSHPRHHGHVAIITSYLSLVGVKPEQHAMGVWGQFGGIGQLLDRLSQSFGQGKHAAIRYAKCTTPIAL